MAIKVTKKHLNNVDSLDNITLDSDETRTIERFENNYYNNKKNIVQNGGDYKLEKNIEKLFTCYLLSNNQFGGGDDNTNLTNKIQYRLNNKIAELIINKNYFNVVNDLEGGIVDIDKVEHDIKMTFYDYIKNFINKNLIEHLKTYLEKLNIKQMLTDYVNQQIAAVGKGAVNLGKGAVDLGKGAVNAVANVGHGAINVGSQALGAVGNLFQR